MLDTRQYRGEPPDPETDGYPEEQYAFDPNMGDQMIGHEQEEWLVETLEGSNARWNVIGNQIGMFDYQSGLQGNIMGWDDHTATPATALCATSTRVAPPTQSS